MDNPLIALAVTRDMRKACFSDETMSRLEALGQLRVEDPETVDEEVTKRIIKDANAVVTCWGTSCRFTAEVLDQAPELKILAHSAGSMRGFFSDALWERDIVVTGAAPALAVGVAEFTLGMMLCSCKRVWETSAESRQGRWTRSLRTAIIEPFQITIGIVAASLVGRHVMKLLQSFEVEVLVYDPFITAEDAQALGATKVELDELVRRSDVVSDHLPNLPATQKLISAELIQSMKDGAIFINTARGATVDEGALVEELKTGRISACLDVTDPEPPRPDSPLWSLPNVVLTPHIAGHAANGRLRQGRFVAEQLERFFSGRPLEYQITREMADRVA